MTHLFVLVCDLFLPRFRSLLPECTTCLPVLLWMSLSFLFVCFYKVCCFGAIIRVFCCRARGFSIYTPGGKITGPSLRRSSGGADSTQWFSNEVVLVSTLSRLLPPRPPLPPTPPLGDVDVHVLLQVFTVLRRVCISQRFRRASPWLPQHVWLPKV